MKNNLIRFLKKKIKKNRFIFWCFFHPDNLFKFKHVNQAEMITWEFITNRMNSYKSLCEIGCFNGRSILVFKEFLKNKIYVGYDLNIFAITIAKIISYFTKNKTRFYCRNAIISANQNCELFVSVATLIYFSEYELKKFIQLLKDNKSFKSIIMHEIFRNDNFDKSKSTIIDDNLNLHSVLMIEDEFGQDYDIKILRTSISNWKKDDRFSALLSIKRIV